MGIYKLTNITDRIGKRDIKYNSILEIEYVDKMIKKIIKLLPKETCYLTVTSLPISIQRLAIKNLLTVSEISSEELNKYHQELNTKNSKTVNEENKRVEDKTVHLGKKKIINKKDDDEI